MTTTRDVFEAEILKNKAAFQIRRVDSGEYQNGCTQELWEFWQVATKAEREACALVCTKRNLGDGSREDQEAVNCANAIKRRGEL